MFSDAWNASELKTPYSIQLGIGTTTHRARCFVSSSAYNRFFYYYYYHYYHCVPACMYCNMLSSAISADKTHCTQYTTATDVVSYKNNNDNKYTRHT